MWNYSDYIYCLHLLSIVELSVCIIDNQYLEIIFYKTVYRYLINLTYM